MPLVICIPSYSRAVASENSASERGVVVRILEMIAGLSMGVMLTIQVQAAEPKRLVSADAGATNMIVALGLADSLVAVDVNTGGDTSPAAGLKANMAALRDLPRQLRLRGLGGQVVVDLAPMAKKDRRPVETELRRALKADADQVGDDRLRHFLEGRAQ